MKYFHPKRYLRLIKAANIYMAIRKAWYRHLSTCRHVEGSWIFKQAGLMNGAGHIIGHDAQLGYYPSGGFYDTAYYLEARHEDAVIELGQSFYNNGFTAVAEHGRITVGNDCLIGAHVQIINSDFHSLSIARRHIGGGKSKDVRIGNNVFIGSNVSIMKGVTVGDNAVIANSSVVFDDVAANTVVRGNPAVFYKELTR